MPPTFLHFSIASDGTMWAVDEADRLWRRIKRHWEQPSPDMRARRVAVGSNDTVWCLDAGGETFLAHESDEGVSWMKVPGADLDILVAAA